MSDEKEYMLASKYNRALNKIEKLEGELALVNRSRNRKEVLIDPELEERDSLVLQRQVVALQESLERVTAERDAAVAKLEYREGKASLEALDVSGEGVEMGDNQVRGASDDNLRKLLNRIDQWALEMKSELVSLSDRTQKSG